MMKKFIFRVLVCTGATFTAIGVGYNTDEGMMDACDKMARSGDIPELDIEDVRLIGVKEFNNNSEV